MDRDRGTIATSPTLAVRFGRGGVMRRTSRWVSVAAAAVLLLVGCGDGNEKPSDVPTPDATSLSSTASQPTSELTDPQVALRTVLLSRYELYIRTLEHVLSTNDPNNSQLREVATGDAFRIIVETALKNKKAGLVGKGRIDTKPTVMAVDLPSSTARISDCQDVGSFRTYSVRTSRPANPTAPPQKLILVKSTLVKLGGSWLVSQQTVEGSCGG